MTTAATAPALSKERDADLNISCFSALLCDAISHETHESESEPTSSDTRPAKHYSFEPASRHYVVWAPNGAAACAVRMYQYGEDTDALILVDFEEPKENLPRNHAETVQFLRTNGRPILAEKLIELLWEAEENPDEVTINIASLHDMARFMVEHGGLADPSISPDGWGVVHAQWRIMGNGLLVMTFLGLGEILLTARADESPGQARLRISKRASVQDILREYGYLVPLRN